MKVHNRPLYCVFFSFVLWCILQDISLSLKAHGVIEAAPCSERFQSGQPEWIIFNFAALGKALFCYYDLIYVAYVFIL